VPRDLQMRGSRPLPPTDLTINDLWFGDVRLPESELPSRTAHTLANRSHTHSLPHTIFQYYLNIVPTTVVDRTHTRISALNDVSLNTNDFTTALHRTRRAGFQRLRAAFTQGLFGVGGSARKPKGASHLRSAAGDNEHVIPDRVDAGEAAEAARLGASLVHDRSVHLGYQYTAHYSSLQAPLPPGLYVAHAHAPLGMLYTRKHRSWVHFLVSLSALLGGVHVVLGLLVQLVDRIRTWLTQH
jgi:hypothetical protein